MNRQEPIRHVETHGCYLLREGGKHSRYVNLSDRSRQSTIPRHVEIDDFLARAICRQLHVPPPLKR